MKLHVITPVGPGHEQLKNRAIESVRIAMYTSMGPFTDVRVRAVDDTDGKMGRSAARNLAVKESDADWLFFLDADDLMHPDCLQAATLYVSRYSAFWGRVVEMRNNCLLERYQVGHVASFDDLLSFDPYMTLQMGHFVQADVAKRYPFREDMDTGEDWDYYLRVWRDERCVKVGDTLMINCRGQHSHGPRSATGKEWRQVVNGLIAEAKRERAA